MVFAFLCCKIFTRGKDGDEKSNKGNEKHRGTFVGHWLLLQLVASIMLSRNELEPSQCTNESKKIIYASTFLPLINLP